MCFVFIVAVSKSNEYSFDLNELQEKYQQKIMMVYCKIKASGINPSNFNVMVKIYVFCLSLFLALILAYISSFVVSLGCVLCLRYVKINTY